MIFFERKSDVCELMVSGGPDKAMEYIKYCTFSTNDIATIAFIGIFIFMFIKLVGKNHD